MLVSISTSELDPLELPQRVYCFRPLPTIAARSHLRGFVRAAPVAYVNNQGDNSTAPDGAGSIPLMTGMRYAIDGAALQAGAQGRASMPVRFAQGVLSAPPALDALSAWHRRLPSGSAGASSHPQGLLDGRFMGHGASTLRLASPYVLEGGSDVPSEPAAARPPSFATPPGAASAAPYGNFGVRAAALSPVAEHETC